MSEPLTIKQLRLSMGLTLEQFGEKIGLSSKGQVSIIERTNECGLRVALAIEALSERRIDAGTLNEDVRLSRETSAAEPGTAEEDRFPFPGRAVA